MAVAHKSAISFGLVHIPVSLYTAVQDNDIHFNQLHRETKERIQYKKTCPHCGGEVKTQDIVKGYQYDKDHYVIVSDDDMEKIKTEADKSIRIVLFTDLSSIKPIYFDKTYHVTPEAGGEKAFELLRTAMLEEHKIAVAKTVLGTKETLIAIMPTEEGLLMDTLFYAEEMKGIPKAYAKPEVNPEELGMAKTLINSMNKPFEPEQYHDEYQMKLRTLIEQKINGKEIVAPQEEAPANVIDLTQALKASLENQRKENKETGKKSSKRAKGA